MASQVIQTDRAEIEAFIDLVLDAYKSGKLVKPVACGELYGMLVMADRGDSTLMGWVRTGAARVASGT